MKISPQCPACLLHRTYTECKMATDDEDKIRKAVEDSLEVLNRRYPKREVNAVIATEMHRRVYEILGVEDPYKKVKDRANEVVMQFLPAIREFVEDQSDKFKASAIASIIGNTFDYGVMGHEVAEDDFMGFFSEQYAKGLTIDDIDKIKEFCGGNVVYLTDNCGEIIVDSLFLEKIKKISSDLTVVVRGKPILSDATIEDAKLAGIDKIADNLLTNGEGAIGIIEDELPGETLEKINNADIIIGKGMANYECLSDSPLPVAFLLTAKCKPVADSLGVSVGDMIAKFEN
ncbi:MAG: damage-control phosphatase ARMT1 family protein [Halobacteriota archaeon]